MLTSNYSSTSSVRASILLGGMFYVVTFFELVALNTLDLNAGFFYGKWRFTDPSWRTWGYFLTSLVAYTVVCVLVLKKKLNKGRKAHQNIYEIPIQRLLFAASLSVIYLLLSAFIFEGNYRTDANAMAKLVMQPIYTVVYSALLLWVLVFCAGHSNPSRTSAALCLVIVSSLAVSVTGAGGAATLIGCAILLLLGRGSKIRHAALGVILMLGAFMAMLIFLATFKYSISYQFMSNEELVTVALDLSSWIISRLLVVTGASVFLIEQAEVVQHLFGPYQIVEIFGNNLRKAGVGDGWSEFRSVGEYVYSQYYSGAGSGAYGVSPGLLGGMTILIPVYFAAPLSGILVFLLTTLVDVLGRVLNSANVIVFFYYFFLQFMFFNPYAMLSVVDPAFLRFIIFGYAYFYA